ncbi:hypothetical protein SMICM17S_12018 [Streptomyces microflavus]
MILNADGTYRSQLVANDGENYAPRCGKDLRAQNPNLDNCLGVVADTSTVYLATQPVSAGKTLPTNAVVAFDAATGRSRWRTDAPAEQNLMPLRVEGGRVLMYLDAMRGYGRSKGGGIYALPPTGGALQPVLRHPESATGSRPPSPPPTSPTPADARCSRSRTSAGATTSRRRPSWRCSPSVTDHHLPGGRNEGITTRFSLGNRGWTEQGRGGARVV